MYSYGNAAFSLKGYISKRVNSIYPMFYMGWILFYFYYFFCGNTIIAENWKIIFTILGIDGYLTAIMNNFYIIGEWFLAILIFLYVTFPILLWLKKKSIFLLVLVAGISYFVGCALNNIGINTYSFPLTRILEFSFGMLFTDYYEKLNNKLKAITVVLCCITFLIFIFIKIPINIFYMHSYTIMGIMSFITFFSISTFFCKIPIYKNLCIEFAKISYPVYLVHHQILGIVASKYFYIPLTRYEMYIMFFAALIIIIISGYTLKKFTLSIQKKLSSMWT